MSFMRFHIKKFMNFNDIFAPPPLQNLYVLMSYVFYRYKVPAL